jgi:hypothetical protein
VCEPGSFDSGWRVRADPSDRFKPLPLEAQTLLGEGHVIGAVKSVRASHRLGLKEAKDWVDAHIAQNPLLRVQLEAQQREARRKFFFWFFVVDAIVIAAVIYWFYYAPR